MSKGVIWASEYSLGPQIWGPGGGLGPSPLDPLLEIEVFSVDTFQVSSLLLKSGVAQW